MLHLSFHINEVPEWKEIHIKAGSIVNLMSKLLQFICFLYSLRFLSLVRYGPEKYPYGKSWQPFYRHHKMYNLS